MELLIALAFQDMAPLVAGGCACNDIVLGQRFGERRCHGFSDPRHRPLDRLDIDTGSFGCEKERDIWLCGFLAAEWPWNFSAAAKQKYQRKRKKKQTRKKVSVREAVFHGGGLKSPECS